MGSLVACAVALGSNLGDRVAHLDFAVAELRALLKDLQVSRYLNTVPVGVSGPQPLYLNAAAVGRTSMAPAALLERLLDIERARGRERPGPNAPRTLDLDLILYGDLVVDEPCLQLPHPRFRERMFVLEPLVEIAATLRDPVTGRTVRQLRDQLSERT